MYEVKDILRVKEKVEKIKGSKVLLESSKGRQKSIIKEGIIDNVYPSIFTVQLSEGKSSGCKVSYSYTDILTKAVSITLCE